MKIIKKLILFYAIRNIPIIPNTSGKARPIISMILTVYPRYPSRRISRLSGSGSTKRKPKLLLRYFTSRNNKNLLMRESKK
jgi:hypothetical protein